MKHLFALSCLLFMHVHAHIDCLDDSYHLTQGYDPKTIHTVFDCNCDCGKGENKILPGTGQCTQCKHYRNPRPLRLLKSNNLALINRTISRMMHNQ